MEKEKTMREDYAVKDYVEIIFSVSREQADKLRNHRAIFDRLRSMTENELIFTETFLEKIFGRCTL